MMLWVDHGRKLARRFAADTSGAAAIEFTFIAIVLFVLLAGIVDLVDEQTRQREVDRIAVEVAEAMGDCPDSDCVRLGIQDLIRSNGVVINQVSGAALGVAEITRVNNAIVMLQGTMTYLPTDVKNEALATLANTDIGVAVLITYNFNPPIGLFPNSDRQIRAYAVALRAKGVVTI
ncbi:TadE/TadG family type IV pilus assembly protein [Brevundimonas aveniformis]|uniref:TadE/TadG family type IV pilus assembly protein n=1 Tax=Brevundimonas aveniformis TaxID=370977 RepID=UPI00041991AB|nr:TadE/TadG family type IV pilus assembly protein [Brevundimonas aveniformis]